MPALTPSEPDAMNCKMKNLEAILIQPIVNVGLFIVTITIAEISVMLTIINRLILTLSCYRLTSASSIMQGIF